MMTILIKDKDHRLINLDYIIEIVAVPSAIEVSLPSGKTIDVFRSRDHKLLDLWMERFEEELSYANGSDASVYIIDLNDHVLGLDKYKRNEGKNDEDLN